jgi:hypothetical protein
MALLLYLAGGDKAGFFADFTAGEYLSRTHLFWLCVPGFFCTAGGRKAPGGYNLRNLLEGTTPTPGGVRHFHIHKEASGRAANKQGGLTSR